MIDFTPGSYLTRRRTIAGLGLTQAGTNAAAHPCCQIVPTRAGRFDPLHRNRTLARLIRAEEDKAPLTFHEAEGLAHVIPFDPAVYLALVDIHLAGEASYAAPPRLCRHCACSQHDPCGEDDNPCGWAEASSSEAVGKNEADLCCECAAAPRQLEDAA